MALVGLGCSDQMAPSSATSDSATLGAGRGEVDSTLETVIAPLGETCTTSSGGLSESLPAGVGAVLQLHIGLGYFAVLNDNTLRAWGGPYSTDVDNMTGVRQVASQAGSHGLILKTDGTVQAFGDNVSGETIVPPGLSGVIQVAVGERMSYALKSDGSVAAWGNVDFREAVTKANGATGCVAIAARNNVAGCIKTDGTVKVFTADSAVDTPAGLTTKIVQLRAVDDGFVALGTDGLIYGWSAFGTPAMPAGGLTDVVTFEAEFGSGCAIQTGGRVTCWGAATSQHFSTYFALTMGATDISRLAMRGGEVLYTTCTGCEAIPPIGCCSGNVLKTCGTSGITTSSCAAGTCGYNGTNAFACGTSGGDSPGIGPKACEPGAPQVCVPSCSGKTCGDDGCGGSCGTCPNGQTCDTQTQTCSSCTPSCNGKQCGADGCGGTCGTCPSGTSCNTSTSTCVSSCTPSCSGKQCGPDGCGGYCGACAAGSTCNQTTGQCGCVSTCDTTPGSADMCGADGCGGTCGAGCPPGQACGTETVARPGGGTKDRRVCVTVCTPQCSGKSCGPDGCGGQCGVCGTQEFCAADASCRRVECPHIPREGCCEGDQARFCGYNSVARTFGEVKESCPSKGQYCGWTSTPNTGFSLAGGYQCVSSPMQTPLGKPLPACPGAPVCVPKCSGKECGSDGCGGTCGTCGTSKVCEVATGKCKLNICNTYKSSWPNSSCCQGDVAVYCDANGVPTVSQCGGATGCRWQRASGPLPVKTAACMNLSDPVTAQNEVLWNRPPACPASVPCIPKCSGKECGADGCGGTCGTCDASAGKVCNASGTCAVDPTCNGVPVGTGCCAGNTLQRCTSDANGTLRLTASDCAASGKFCGFDATGATQDVIGGKLVIVQSGAYACNLTGLPEATGNKPFKCPLAPACVKKCDGRSCGPDGCGGTCGTCPNGGACDNVAGKCLAAPCGGVAPLDGCALPKAGPLATQKYLRCPGITATAADVQLLECNSPTQPFGWDSLTQRMKCGANEAPPAGRQLMCDVAKLPTCRCWNNNGEKNQCGLDGCGKECGGGCPKGAQCQDGPFGRKCEADPNYCEPQCQYTSAECGDDGCGGSCGQCAAGSSCLYGKCRPGDCGSVQAEGVCEGNVAKYCVSVPASGATPASNKLISVDCAASGGTCGTVGGIVGRYGADGVTCLPPAQPPVQPKLCSAQCGVDDGTTACQCDAGCVTRGDCCADFETPSTDPATQNATPSCAETLFRGSCGNGTCEPQSSETCTSCPGDCGACGAASTMPSSPPWNAPYSFSMVHSGLAGAHLEENHTGLNDVRPPPTPLPTKGLVARLDGAQLRSGGAGAWAGLTADALNQGNSSAGTDPARGDVLKKGAGATYLYVTTTQQPLSRAPSWSRNEQGGLTVAAWVNPGAETQIPLFSMTPSGANACGWARPDDNFASVSCPNGSTILAIDAYYGDVADLAEGPRTCDRLNAARPLRTCEKDVSAFARGACLGKYSCGLDFSELGADPCGGSAGSAKARPILRAICSDKPNTLMAYVDGVGRGKLTYRRNGDWAEARTSSALLPKDTWTHVAVTWAPTMADGKKFMKQGVATLYINGAQALSTDPFDMTDISHVFIGGLPRNASLANGPVDIDEVNVFGRQISEGELAQLMSSSSGNVLGIWPPVESASVVGSRWITRGKATVVPVELPQLRAPETPAPKAPKLLRAAFDGLRLGAGTTFTHAATNPAIANLSKLTVLGWVRVPTLTADKPLFTLSADTSAQVTVNVASACGGTGLAVVTPSGTVTSSDCTHGLAANDWALVAYVQDGTSQTLYLDGARVATGSAGAPLFTAAASVPRVFTAGDGVDLGWTAVFGEALTASEVSAWRSPGPSAWFDGKLFVPADAAGTARPRDLGGLHNNASGVAKDQPVAIDPGTGAPLTEASRALSLGTAAIRIPARGRVLPLAGTRHAAVSLVGTQRLAVSPTLFGATPSTIVTRPLVQTDANGALALVSNLVCVGRRAAEGAEPNTLTCNVEILDGTRHWQSASRTVTFADSASYKDLEVTVGLSLGATPSVTLHFRGLTAAEVAKRLNTLALSDEGASKVLPMSPVDGLVHPLTLPGSFGSQSASSLLIGVTPAPGVGLRDVRFYTRVLTDAELAYGSWRGCDAERCGGRQCEASPANVSDVPGGVDASYCSAACDPATNYAVGGRCEPKRASFADCTADSQCLGGKCLAFRNAPSDPGDAKRCAFTSVAECGAACAVHGRECNTNEGVSFCTSASAGCIDNFIPRDWGCEWAGAKRTGEECNNDTDCESGACVDAVVRKYDVATVANYELSNEPNAVAENTEGLPRTVFRCKNPQDGGTAATCATAATKDQTRKVCAGRSAQQCKDEHRTTREVTATTGPQKGQKRYLCEPAVCEATEYAGQKVWRLAWDMMSPEACQKMVANYYGMYKVNAPKYADQLFPTTTLSYSSRIIDLPPSIERLRVLLLKDAEAAGPVTPASVSKLELAGVGPKLIGFAGLSKEKQNALAPYIEDGTHQGKTLMTYPMSDNESTYQYHRRRLSLADCYRGLTFNAYGLRNPSASAPERGLLVSSAFARRDTNGTVCLPNKYPDGTTCPPPDTNYARPVAGQFCISGFCAADTSVCEEGYGVYEDNQGEDRKDNKQNEDNSGESWSFGLSQTNATVVNASKSAGTTSGDARSYVLKTKNEYFVSIFFPYPLEIVSLGVQVIADMGKQTASMTQSLSLFGTDLAAGDAPRDSCGGEQWVGGTWQKSSTCKPPRAATADGLSAGLVDPTRIKVIQKIFPVPKLNSCDDTDSGLTSSPFANKPGGAKNPYYYKSKSGPRCYTQTTFVGPVPIMIEAKLTIKAGAGIGAELDPDTIEPAFKAGPIISIGVGVKGGVGGGAGPIKIFAGVKASITIVEIFFPTKWALAIKQASKKTGEVVSMLYNLVYTRGFDIELTFLKLVLGVTFEVKLTDLFPFSIGFDFFTFNGFKIVIPVVKSDPLFKKKLDFLWTPY